jgi:hypothetical protein
MSKGISIKIDPYNDDLRARMNRRSKKIAHRAKCARKRRVGSKFNKEHHTPNDSHKPPMQKTPPETKSWRGLNFQLNRIETDRLAKEEAYYDELNYQAFLYRIEEEFHLAKRQEYNDDEYPNLIWYGDEDCECGLDCERTHEDMEMEVRKRAIAEEEAEDQRQWELQFGIGD